ncbi:MAG: nuclear transport factor 2 family protein [Caulobacteraceae bacterium]
MTRHHFAGAAIAILAAASLGACAKPMAAAGADTSTAAGVKPAVDTGKIAAAVKADVDQLVADANAHDATKAASHDAPDAVIMSHGQADIVGADADMAMAKKGFAADPTQHVTVADEKVDVANSGDMAVYRSTYVFTGMNPVTRKPMTEHGNYAAGYKLQPDGAWKIQWSMTADTPAPAAAAAAKS